MWGDERPGSHKLILDILKDPTYSPAPLSADQTAQAPAWLRSLFPAILRSTCLLFSGSQLTRLILRTLAAQLTTLPVMVYHFQRLSLSSLLVNPLILPVQPAVMFLSGIAMLLGMISQALGQVIAYLSWPFVVYTIRVVELLAHLPSGVIVLGRVSLLVVAFFLRFADGMDVLRCVVIGTSFMNP